VQRSRTHLAAATGPYIAGALPVEIKKTAAPAGCLPAWRARAQGVPLGGAVICLVPTPFPEPVRSGGTVGCCKGEVGARLRADSRQECRYRLSRIRIRDGPACKPRPGFYPANNSSQRPAHHSHVHPAADLYRRHRFTAMNTTAWESGCSARTPVELIEGRSSR